MKCKLVALSQPTIEGVNSAEEFIAYCARVSNPANQLNSATADKLVRYLIKNKHWSPFEMVHATIEVQTTRDIARQMLRHRSFSFQEFSQRYAEAQSFVLREARLQDYKNRQNSIETDEEALKSDWQLFQKQLVTEATATYDWALTKGIAKEQARVVLPEGLTGSTLYVSGTLRSWIHYCQLRMENGTQKEHRLIAQECWEILRQHFPNVVKACEPEPQPAKAAWKMYVRSLMEKYL